MSNVIKRVLGPSSTTAAAGSGSAPRRAWLQLAAGAAGLGVVAILLPPPGALARAALGGGTAGLGAGAVDQAVLLLAGLAVWSLLGWLLLIAGCAGLARMPGVPGLAAGRLLRRVAPAAAGRLVAASLGVAVLGGVTGCAFPALTGDGQTTTTVPTISIDWPRIDASSSVLLGGDPAPESPTPAAPSTLEGPPAAPAAEVDTRTAETAADSAGTGRPESSARASEAPSTDPVRPSAAPAENQPPALPTEAGQARQAPAARNGVAAETVVVRHGDSLWRIASERLPGATEAAVDTAWRRWYSANRVTIGADPDVILPGQVLLVPDAGDRS